MLDFGWRNARLTDEEIKTHFPEGAANVAYDGPDIGKDKDSLTLSFNSGFLPYGDFTTHIHFIDPEVPRKPDGSLLYEEMSRFDLFGGGFNLGGGIRYVCSRLNACTTIAHALQGWYREENDLFFVYGHGLVDHGDVLISIRRSPEDTKTEQLMREMLKHVKRSTTFTSENGIINDVIIIPQNATFNTKGKPAGSTQNLKQLLTRYQIEHFDPTLSSTCIDDGVLYSNAWVIDQDGCEIPPTSVITCKGRLPYQIKQWNELRAFDLCLGCYIKPDGQVRFPAVSIPFMWTTNQSGVATELQRRRMHIIHQAVTQKMQKNFEQYKTMLDKQFLTFPDWDAITELKRI